MMVPNKKAKARHNKTKDDLAPASAATTTPSKNDDTRAIKSISGDARSLDPEKNSTACITCKPCKIMMILSPAKTLDLSPLSDECMSMLSSIQEENSLTQPDSCNAPSKTRSIVQAMKQKSEGELMKLLGISKDLAKTAAQYWKNFEMTTNKEDDAPFAAAAGCEQSQLNTKRATPPTTTPTIVANNHNNAETGKPCVYCFSGPAYQGLQVSTCQPNELRWLQERLRIVDPVYGLLRPLDVMQPYRLEMGTKGLCLSSSTSSSKEDPSTSLKAKPVKLADYWKTAVTNRLLEELTQTSQIPQYGATNDQVLDGILLNLASDEYAAAVDASQFDNNHDNDSRQEGAAVKMVRVLFWEQGRVVAVHAKRARGLMALYLARIQATTVDHIREFQDEGYRYVATKSNEAILVFDRDKNWKQTQAKQSSKRPTEAAEAASESRPPDTTTTTGKRSTSRGMRKRKQPR
ncbi:hypothetical protein ACA910_022425 [Epithemia clementina (nom. ined.)]